MELIGDVLGQVSGGLFCRGCAVLEVKCRPSSSPLHAPSWGRTSHLHYQHLPDEVLQAEAGGWVVPTILHPPRFSKLLSLYFIGL